MLSPGNTVAFKSKPDDFYFIAVNANRHVFLIHAFAEMSFLAVRKHDEYK